MPFRFLYSALFGLMLTALCSWSAEGARTAWTLNPFESEAAQLIAAVDEIKVAEGQDLKIPLSDVYLSIDEHHREIERWYLVFQVLNQRSLENWSSLSTSYSPWRQDKPGMRARVINPDGMVYELDPAHIVDSNSEMKNNIYSDLHTISAPLPKLMVGSIVECEIVKISHTPLFGTGTNNQFLLQSQIPVYCHRVVIDLPEKMEFKYKTSFMDGFTPIIKKQDGRVSYLFELIAAPEMEPVESFLPPDVARYRMVRFSTARSWQSVAAAYDQVIDQALVGEEFSGIPQFEGKSPHATAVAILAWINENTRYTGLELGVNSIIPFKPAETIKRGWGDCKDQATLMVGLLRRAGYKADVALLRVTDPKIDIDPDLPGLSLFNHAIVYLDEDGGHWYDPTSQFERDGFLPLSDQGVYALVANRRTRGLVRTSESKSVENRKTKSLVYNMNDRGYGDFVFSSEFSGSFESDARGYISALDEEQYIRYLKNILSSKFRSGKLGNFQVPDFKDLSRPFKIEFEAQEIGRAVTEDTTGVVAIMRDPFSNVLDIYFEENADQQEGERQRKTDFHLLFPFSVQVNSTIHLPEGFVFSNMIQEVVRPLGTMTYQLEVKTLENGDITLIETLDSGKQRLNAGEFEQTRTAVQEFLKEGPIFVNMEHLGQKLLNQGDYSGGMKVFRDAIAKSPEKSIHHHRFAKALSTAGFFMEARKEARLACEKAPDDADAWTFLGNLLILDPLGRQFYPGFDLEGALAAFNKAIEIDPSKMEAMINCGVLLEHTSNGIRYGRHSNLKGANDYYRKLDDESLKTYGENLLLNLILLGEYSQALEQFERLKHLDVSEVWKFVSLIGQKGLDAVLPQMNQIQGQQERASLFLQTGMQLTAQYRIREGVALLRLAARGVSNGLEIDALADLYQNLVKFEDISPDFKDPRYVIQYFFKYLMCPEGEDFSELRRVTSPEFYSAVLDPRAESAFLGLYSSNFKECKEGNHFPDQWAALKISTLVMVQSGDVNNGFMVKGNMDGLPFTFYLAPHEDGLKIVAEGDYGWLAGHQILRFLEENRLDTARIWVDWIRNNSASDDLSDPLDPIGSFSRIKGDSPEALTLIANCLMMDGPHKDKIFPVLIEASARYRDHEWAPFISYNLVSSLARVEHSKFALNLAKDFQAQYPDSFKANYILGSHLLNLRQKDSLLALLEDLRQQPQLMGLHQVLSYRLQKQENSYEGLKKFLLEECDAADVTANQYHVLAWRALFEETLSEEALTYARNAVGIAGDSNYSVLHTLATLYAESGRNVEARQLLVQTIEAGTSLSPQSNDWYIIGRLAEQYGLSESAIEAYNKVEKPELESNIPYSTWTLAQRALKRVSQAELQ